MGFSFDGYVDAVRKAIASDNPNAAVRATLAEIVADPDPIIAATPVDGEDEINLYEDDTVSIWHCRFKPHVLMPPHEHLLDVHIAGYSDGEKSIMFKCENGKLVHDRTIIVRPGDVVSLKKDEMHAVTAEGDQPSLALHVYMGPLNSLKLGLFDWVTGERVDFSQENFDKMKRPASELSDRF